MVQRCEDSQQDGKTDRVRHIFTVQSTSFNESTQSPCKKPHNIHENRVQLTGCFLNGEYKKNLLTGCAIGKPSLRIPLPRGSNMASLKKIFPADMVLEKYLRLSPSYEYLAVIASPDIAFGDISNTDISKWYTVYSVRKNNELLVRIISYSSSEENWNVSRPQWNYLKGANCEKQANFPSPLTFITHTEWNEHWEPSRQQKQLLDLHGPEYGKMVPCRCSDCLELDEKYELNFATPLKDYSVFCFRMWIMQSCNACKKLLASPNFDLPITLRQLIYCDNLPKLESKENKERAIAHQNHLRLFGSNRSTRSWYSEPDKWAEKKATYSAAQTHTHTNEMTH